ncbi:MULTISPECIES: peptidoglycan-binding protein [Azospirillum]|nr:MULTISPECIES: peptidoglycan-binding protein [Azospirillum]MDW7555804.1 peptidoglycan-binding protein [Azospirillum brasilense]MDW7595881.1 peptidoglycan-binding protein [Azospirillum brasilense]MDW7630886.1 peptidoglycan-binding protein [Azospirillum brasilense]MDX5951492.1 peptidoglycan-binding protein [Azospirillum brasilense]TVZ49083.1 uncharacterized protein DUF3380 [Azospirillum brasilense]
MTNVPSGAAEAVRLPVVVGAARPLGPNDIATAAAALGVEEAAYRAVLIVETGGRSAYRPDGRMPILFEAHIAFRLNGGVTVPGLAEQSWDRGLYSSTAAGEYDGVLGIGDVGPDVAALQRALQRCGFPSIVEDGDFGRRTANAVEQVQAVHRLPVTGWVDTRTAIALGLV